MFAHLRSAGLLAVTLAGVAGAQAPVMATVKPFGPASNPWGGSIPAISPDGRFTIMGNDTALIRLDRTTGRWATVAPLARIGRMVQQVAWSPNGRFIAYARPADGEKTPSVWIMPMDPKTGLASGIARRVSVGPGASPAWSPDGRRIAFGSRGRILVAPFNGGAETVVTEGGFVGGGLFWSPDGLSIYTVQLPGGTVTSTTPRPIRTIIRVNVASGKIDSMRSGGPLIGLSKDGRYLAQHDNTIRGVVISLASNGAFVGAVSAPRGIKFTAWSPLAPDQMIGSKDITEGNIHAVALATGAVTEITKGLSDYYPVYSPDGKKIAYLTRVGDWIGGRVRLAIANSDGSGARLVGDVAGRWGDFRWSPDGRYVGYASKEPDAILLVDVAAGTDREVAQISPSPDNWAGYSGIVWRADSKAIRFIHGVGAPGHRMLSEVTLDGKMVELAALPGSDLGTLQFVNDTLLAATTADTLRLVSVSTGRPVRAVPAPAGTTYNKIDKSFAVTSDGQWLGMALTKLGDKAQNCNWTPLGDNAPYVLSLKTGEFRAIPYAVRGMILQMGMDPAGRFLVFSSCPADSDHGWDVVQLPVNGDPPRVLSAKDPKFRGVNSYAVSPDSRTLLYDADTFYGTVLVEITLPSFVPQKKP